MPSFGGSIFVQGDNATILNANISSSTADVSGGAIYIHGHYADIINSSFEKTTSKGAAAANGGGAIYIDGHYASIVESNFTIAKTTGKDAKGGAIYIMGNFAVLNGSYIEKSQTEKIGGAVYIQGNDATIIGSNFSDNYAGQHGGALYTKGVGSKVYNSSFYDNKVNGGYKDKSGKHGGAIYWEGASMNDLIEGCYFEGNIASQGACIFMASNLDVDTAGTVRKCTFNDNRAARGGAIAWEKSKKALIENCNFTNNIAEKHGAAIFAGAASSSGAEFSILNCTFENNTVYAGVGGAISLRISNSKIVSCNFVNNSAAQGGSIILKETGVSNVVIDQCNFTDSLAFSGGNEDGSGGGAIAVWGTDPYSTTSHTVNITLTNSKFVNCSSKVYSGGAVDWTSPDGRIENCTFINCSAPYGGSIGFSASNTNLKNLTIINSTSAGNGSAIYIGYIKVRDVEFKNPQDFELIDIKIIGAKAGENGAIYFDHYAHDISLTNSSISNSSADANGGALYIDTSKKISVSNANFTNNTACGNGGAIFTYSGTDNDHKNNPFTITDSVFNLNHAGGDGGAIYSGYIASEITNCNFTNNTASNGGAIIVTNHNQRIRSCDFIDNKAVLNGGSISLVNAADINISDSTFKNSRAYNGGAVFIKNDDINEIAPSIYIYNDTFIDNIASHNGGAIFTILDANTDHPVFYRDLDDFEGRAEVNSTTHRTDLKVTMETLSIQVVFHSYFKNNVDYALLVEVNSTVEEVYTVIYINNPRDVEKKSSNITVFVSKVGDITKNCTIIVNDTTFDNYFINGRLEIDIPKEFLDVGTTYNVNMRFEDGNYLNKSFTSQFTTSDNLKHGDFWLLQRAINTAISNGKSGIVLDRNYRFTIDVDVPDDRCMNLTNIPYNFTIDGAGHIIDARGFARIFNITSENVTLKNIIFDRGNASGQFKDNISKGGAVFWAGANGNVMNSTFRNSFAEYGGGIYYNVTAQDSTIYNCTFTENNATYNGGAIDCNASSMGLYNTTFKTNYADYGAALCREINATKGHGFNNTFIDNHAVSAGAALAWINASSIHIDNYFFYNNTAGFSGGAIYVGEGSGNCEIINCDFKNNYVLNETDGHGGAIEWYAEKGLVSNSNFTSNHAYNGGAIYVGSQSGKINITDSNFNENYATTNGGAISIDASGVTINASNFYDNYANNGGALYAGGEGETNYVYSSVFEGNKASRGYGGAIDWVASSGHIISSNITNNNASYGGGIYFGGKSTESVISNCIFTDNHATYLGGAIDCNSSKMNLTHTLFDGNYAQFGAALCREVNAKGGFGVNNTFKNNHAYISGAALGWMGSVNITITNYTFINNSADISGGAIYVSPDSHNCSIISSNFEDNYVTNVTDNWGGKYEWTDWDGITTMTYYTREAPNDNLINKTIMEPDYTIYYYVNSPDDVIGVGGAVACLASNATVNESNFTNNTAKLGGAFYAGSDSGNTLINGSRFEANIAHERGGAVNLHASGVDIDNSEFYNNIAVNGSAVYVGGVGTDNKVYRSVFEGNNATVYGGAIYWIAGKGEIKESNFTNNRAVYGGGIYFNGQSANTTLTGVIFKYNNATKNGGAIDCNAKNIGIYNITFESNYAGEYGAALCRESGATGGHGTINTFISNHAGIAGAALA